ncbi:MAG: PAS domain S-box protein [Methanomicrobiaceae archaeon]|nr:PAS domain S-box protein [Methanomicrobiaceae archaeon]
MIPGVAQFGGAIAARRHAGAPACRILTRTSRHRECRRSIGRRFPGTARRAREAVLGGAILVNEDAPASESRRTGAGAGARGRKPGAQAADRCISALDERAKELSCIYAVSSLVGEHGMPVGDILQRTAELVRHSMQYPGLASVRIACGDAACCTRGYVLTPWRLERALKVNGGHAGAIEVCYREDIPFLPEERSLLAGIAWLIEHRSTEEALRASEQRLAAVINFLPIALFQLGPGGRIVDANNAAEVLTGYDRRELSGRRLRELCLLDGVRREERKPGEAREVAIIRKDGSRISVEIALSSTVIGGERITLCTARDITRKKEVEQVQMEALRQIEENIEHMAILNDQIRNPLTVIIALAEMGGTEIDERITEQAWEINEIITRLDWRWLVSGKIREFLRKHFYEQGEEA